MTAPEAAQNADDVRRVSGTMPTTGAKFEGPVQWVRCVCGYYVPADRPYIGQDEIACEKDAWTVVEWRRRWFAAAEEARRWERTARDAIALADRLQAQRNDGDR